MEYTTDNENTAERLASIKFVPGDILYVSGKSLIKRPELFDYGYRTNGFKFLCKKIVAAHKRWWQFWIPKEYPVVMFIYKPEEID